MSATQDRQEKKRETERSELESSIVSCSLNSSPVPDFLLQASGLGLDLETHRELGAIKMLVISRYQRLRFEELNLTLKNVDRKDKDSRFNINNKLKTLQYTASAPPLQPLEEIQSRVDALLMRLEERESDLLVDLNEGISSLLCELTRQGLLQLIRHFDCGLVLPSTDDGSAVAAISLEREMAALERKNVTLEQDLAALRRKQGLGLKVVVPSHLSRDSHFFCHRSLTFDWTLSLVHQGS
jgi:hypothetical protein